MELFNETQKNLGSVALIVKISNMLPIPFFLTGCLLIIISISLISYKITKDVSILNLRFEL
jgi:hypothetical protein